MLSPLEQLYELMSTIRPKNGDTRLLLAALKGTASDLIEQDYLPNCLSYSLRFWDRNRNYCIYYNSDHCINLLEKDETREHARNLGFLPLYEFGYDYFCGWHRENLISDLDMKLLTEYFKK